MDDLFLFGHHLFLFCMMLGFVAQLISSSLGMAYSITCSSVLLVAGVPPVMSSATVHASEVVNRLLSGISHVRFGTLDRTMTIKLAIFGSLGAFAGAFLLNAMPVVSMRVIIACMLFVFGVRILVTGFSLVPKQVRTTNLGALGCIGGFVDVIGGGGWGPVVTATLLLRGNQPGKVIGSINFAKFFVAVVESATLMLLLKTPQWTIIGGLVSGGAIAAPMGAWACRHLPSRSMNIMVGVLVSGLSIITLLKTLL